MPMGSAKVLNYEVFGKTIQDICTVQHEICEIVLKNIDDCQVQLNETEQELMYSNELMQIALAVEAEKLALWQMALAELEAARASMNPEWIAQATVNEERARAEYNEAVRHLEAMQRRVAMAKECVQMACARMEETRLTYTHYRSKLDETIKVQFERIINADEKIKKYLSVNMPSVATSKDSDGNRSSGDKNKDLQRQAIKDALEKLARGEELTDKEKGNLCEMMMDQYYKEQGYEPLHEIVKSLDDKGHQGIDGVYEKTNPDGSKSYIIADAKYGQSPLSTTVDGTKQMSDDWIDKRLDDAVGKVKADEIREAYENSPSSISKEVYHYNPVRDSNGNTRSEIFKVDDMGNRNSDKEVVQRFDESGNIV